MVRTILYINEVFCQTVDQLKEIISNPQLVKNDSFRLEILSLYKDGILEKWFEERGLSFNVTSTNSNDDDIFIRLYKEITGDNECPNFDSDFSKLGEFLRCEIDKKIYKEIHRDDTIYIVYLNSNIIGIYPKQNYYLDYEEFVKNSKKMR